MWSIKTDGGLNKGQGMTEQQRTVWLLSTPASGHVNHVMQQVSGVCYNASEQYKKFSKSHTNKDYKDAVMVMQYLLPQSPFYSIKELINIHTREVADRNLNADEVYKIRLKIIESMTGVDIDNFMFKKKDQAVIMKSESSIKIDNEEIFVDAVPLFQWLIALVKGIGCDVDVETAF